MKRLIRSGIFYSVFALLVVQLVVAQPRTERLTILNYNLLFYRQTTQFCTAAQNSAVAKDGYMRTIFDYVQPDIIAAQEIGSNPVNLDRILTNVLNINGVSSWEHGPYFANSSQNIVNGLFYNGAKIGYKSMVGILQDLNGVNLVRSIEIHRLYYKDSLLGFGADTVFFSIAVAHLKAGSTGSDQNDRAAATQVLMQRFLADIPDQNRFFAGDFNVRSSNETSFQNLINHSNANLRFRDPIDRLGTWHMNPSFADIHTQSTRTNDNTNGGCFVGGGLDDRLDFILVSQSVMDGSDGMQYVPGSYTTIGQDGIRFNRNLIDSTFSPNNSVPHNVLMALFNMSDHLPVSMQVDVVKQTVGTRDLLANATFKYNNPAREGVRIQLSGFQSGKTARITLVDMTGRPVLTSDFEMHQGQLDAYIPIESLATGMYMLRLESGGQRITRKLIVQ
jgi:endonuclease/exonuclease/phosphatase family metal-dependent hydrolase